MQELYEYDNIYWYWLCNIKGIGNVKRKQLLECFKTPLNLFKASKEELAAAGILTKEDIVQLINSKDIKKIQSEYKILQQMNINFINPQYKEYPENLHSLYDKPMGLYYKGCAVRQEIPVVAVVGARACSEYGKWVAAGLSKEFAKMGIAVVSGMAAGIDTAAHRGCMEGGGITYAVLGCGVDVCYPRENINLYMDIQKQGCILSEYPNGTKPLPGLFPMRNRIISGIADAVVVVEARKRSGSLITADQALEQNKEVYVVPGRIGDSLSEGCLELIKQGAPILTEPEDILNSSLIRQKIQFLTQKKEKNFVRNVKSQKNKLASQKDMVYSCLDLYPKSIDTIMNETGFTIAEASRCLLQLEMEGRLEEVTKNLYIRRPD